MIKIQLTLNINYKREFIGSCDLVSLLLALPFPGVASFLQSLSPSGGKDSPGSARQYMVLIADNPSKRGTSLPVISAEVLRGTPIGL